MAMKEGAAWIVRDKVERHLLITAQHDHILDDPGGGLARHLHQFEAVAMQMQGMNGVAFSMEKMQPLYKIRQGGRYRIKLRNGSDDIHPLHLHRHSFELVEVAGKPTAGVIKDVVMLGGYQEVAFDFVADNPGLTLFHCHQQLHMDFGLMALFDYA